MYIGTNNASPPEAGSFFTLLLAFSIVFLFAQFAWFAAIDFFNNPTVTYFWPSFQPFFWMFFWAFLAGRHATDAVAAIIAEEIRRTSPSIPTYVGTQDKPFDPPACPA